MKITKNILNTSASRELKKGTVYWTQRDGFCILTTKGPINLSDGSERESPNNTNVILYPDAELILNTPLK